MSLTAQESVSVWMATTDIELRPPLKEDGRADVCIVGAGIAGLTIAYLLVRAGKSVIVLDDGNVGGGMTGRTTAHLVTALDDRYFELERLHGTKGARLAAESHRAAIDQVERIVEEEKIDCEFERLDGFLFVPPGESWRVLDLELAAAHRCGLSDIELVERAPIESFETGKALRFPRQAQFHPLKYLAGLARAIERERGRIYNRTHAASIEGGKDHARIETSDGHIVFADWAIVATNSPVNDRFAIHTKQAGYQTYVISGRIPRGSVVRALFWDTPDPYHYVRIQSAGEDDLLIAGGEDHKTGQEDDAERRFGALEEWTRTHFPMMKEIEYRWSGEVMEPVDGLAFIGRNPLDNENVLIATGDSGNGMTHGTIAGMLLTDIVLGKQNEWQTIYDPSRKTLRAARRFIEENLNVAEQFLSFVSRGEVDSTTEIAPGSGAVIRKGLKKVAAYRDESGILHLLSPVCRHLGCIVDWNSFENTWDCPCHGSRYDALGRVIMGPANSDLPAIDEEES